MDKFVDDLDMLWELIKDRLWVMEKTYAGTTEVHLLEIRITLRELAHEIKIVREMLEAT